MSTIFDTLSKITDSLLLKLDILDMLFQDNPPVNIQENNHH